MNKHSKNYRQNELKIRRIDATCDHLTGRAGLFVAYLHGIEIFGWFGRCYKAFTAPAMICANPFPANDAGCDDQ